MTEAERKTLQHEANGLTLEVLEYLKKRTGSTSKDALISALAIKNCFTGLMQVLIAKGILDEKLFGMVSLELRTDDHEDDEMKTEQEWDA